MSLPHNPHSSWRMLRFDVRDNYILNLNDDILTRMATQALLHGNWMLLTRADLWLHGWFDLSANRIYDMSLGKLLLP